LINAPIQSAGSEIAFRFVSDSSTNQQGFSATVTCDVDAPASATISTYASPIAACDDLPLTGDYAGDACENYRGGSFTALGLEFIEDPDGKCALEEFKTKCCFCGQLEIFNSCDILVDLSERAGLEFIRTSPLTDTLLGRGDTEALSCAGADDGPERLFSLDVPPGMLVRIGMPDNTFDSRHELRWGGDCPGDNPIECLDDPDDYFIEWVNQEADVQKVYFHVGTYGEAGDFTLSWELASLTSEIISFGTGNMVNIEAHIRTESYGGECTWNIDGIPELTFGPLEDTQGDAGHGIPRNRMRISLRLTRSLLRCHQITTTRSQYLKGCIQ
jgi:hypothetical protein